MSLTIGEILEEWWKQTESLTHLFTFVVIYFVTCSVLYRICARRSLRKTTSINYRKRVLILTAHPDDECMFFGPTILSLLRNECDVHLICFSRGGYDFDEKLRQSELWAACQTLGISSSNITIYSDTLLPDDPNVKWPVDRLGEIIIHHVESLGINSIITFDREGVSGHLNHISLFYTIAFLGVNGRFSKNVKLFTLDSVNLLRKYWGYLDLPLSFIMSSNRHIISWKDSRTIVSAMKKHKSQLVWFRRLYLLFSRFLVINTLKEVTVVDLELELQLED